MLGQHEKGLELCSYALENNTDDQVAFYCQVLAFLKLDKYEDVLKTYKYYPHLIEVMEGYYGPVSLTFGGFPVPADVIAHYHLGNYDQAYEILEVTRSHSDSRVAPVYALAQVGVLEKQGKGELGGIILREVMRDTQGGQSISGFYGTGIDYNFIRGWIYFSLRDFEKSVEYLEAVRGENEAVANLKVIVHYEWDKRSATKQLENVIAGSDELIYGGCGKGTVLVNGVCKLAPSAQAKSIFGSIEPIYIIIGVVAIGGTVAGVIAVIKRGSKTPRPAKQELDEYEEPYLAKEKPKRKPAKKKETSAFCENCGNKLNPKAKFCGSCGTRLD
jgi:tetratricopeptide (TPR) repeat protein